MMEVEEGGKDSATPLVDLDMNLTSTIKPQTKSPCESPHGIAIEDNVKKSIPLLKKDMIESPLMIDNESSDGSPSYLGRLQSLGTVDYPRHMNSPP